MRCLPAALSWFHADAFPRFSKPWGSLGRLQRPKRLENLSLIVFGPDHHSISHRGNEFSRAPIVDGKMARNISAISSYVSLDMCLLIFQTIAVYHSVLVLIFSTQPDDFIFQNTHCYFQFSFSFPIS